MQPITIRQQKRKSLAFQLNPDGACVLIPHGLDPDSDVVKAFIEKSLAKLPKPSPSSEPLAPREIHALVMQWSQKIGVTVARTQIRTMRNKWGSISTQGVLTIADHILLLPYALAEYIIVHELLHLKFPDHRKGWQVSMGMYLADWRERERLLQPYIVEAMCPP